MNRKSILSKILCNIYSNVYWLFVILLSISSQYSYSIVLYNNSSSISINKNDKLSFVNNKCTINRNSELWANIYSRHSPEIDLLKSTANNPSSNLGPLKKHIDIPDIYMFRDMAELLKRGIQMNKIKELYFDPMIVQSDYSPTDELYIPPFRPHRRIENGKEVITMDSKIPLIGRDYPLYKDGMINLEKNKFKFEDVLCQTLISSILEYDKITEFQSTFEKMPADDIFKQLEIYSRNNDPRAEELKEMLDHSFVPNEQGIPIYLGELDREYKRGLEELRKSGRATEEVLDRYNNMYYQKMKDSLDKIMSNIRVFKQLTDNIKLSTINTDIIKPLIERSLEPNIWTGYLNNIVLKYLYKYSKLEAPGAVDKIPIDEKQYDLLSAYLFNSHNTYFNLPMLKEQEELYNKYVDFHLNRRRLHKRMSPKLMPYWIWYDFWRDRENFIFENFYTLLRDIVISDPYVDLSELTKGTIEQMLRSYVPPTITSRNVNLILDSYIESDYMDKNKHMNKIIDLINKYSSDRSKKMSLEKRYDYDSEYVPYHQRDDHILDLNKMIDNMVDRYNKNKEKKENKQQMDVIKTVIEKNEDFGEDDYQKDLIKREGQEIEHKSVAYHFKDMLSFDKFEEAYKKFNLKHFGKEDYELYKGQLIKGKVYSVSRSKVVADIHAHTLGTMTLDKFYNTPYEVPLKGFLTLFKPGDELMFEVDEIWDDNIMLSMKKIRTFHRFKNILEKRAKNHIFYGKVIQRYSKGVLVQYSPTYIPEILHEKVYFTGEKGQENMKYLEEKYSNEYEDLESQKKYASRVMSDRLDDELLMDVGWVPLKNLRKSYKSRRAAVDMNLYGKTIPVMFESYDPVNNIPVLSNLKALQMMQMMHLRKGDVVKGNVLTYFPYHLGIKIGQLDSYLDVEDMNEEHYKQHQVDFPKSVVAKVKYINPITNTVSLTTKDMFDLSERSLIRTNLFQKKFKKHPIPYNVNLYNSFIDKYNARKAKMNELKNGSKTTTSTFGNEDKYEDNNSQMDIDNKVIKDKDEYDNSFSNKSTLDTNSFIDSDLKVNIFKKFEEEEKAQNRVMNDKQDQQEHLLDQQLQEEQNQQDDTYVDERLFDFEKDQQYVQPVKSEFDKQPIEWRLVGDKLLDDPSLTKGYYQHIWYILLDKWVQLPRDIQDKLNYQFNNNNQIGYFEYLRDSYKVFFDKNVAITLKNGVEYEFDIRKFNTIYS